MDANQDFLYDVVTDYCPLFCMPKKEEYTAEFFSDT